MRDYAVETVLIAIITAVAGVIASLAFPGMFSFLVALAAFVVSNAYFSRRF